MIPIPKAALDLAITVIAAITSEVIEARKHRAANEEGNHDLLRDPIDPA